MSNDGNVVLSNGGAAAAVTSRASNLLGPASLDIIRAFSENDTSAAVTLPFPVTFNGVSYTSISIGSNSYVTFGNGSSTPVISPSSPPFPAILINAGDHSYQRLYTGSENGGATYRLRFEGSAATSGVVGEPTIVWEMTFTAATPAVIKFDVGLADPTNGQTSAISDGVGPAYLATFDASTGDQGFTVSFNPPDYYSVNGTAFSTAATGGAVTLPVRSLSGTATASTPITRWRIYVTANEPGQGVGMNEVQFRSTAGVAQLFSGGSASASSSTSGGNPGNAADNNLISSWDSGSATSPWWWQYDYAGAMPSIAEYTITVNKAYVYPPVDFELQYYDAAALVWVPVDSRTGVVWGTSETKTFTTAQTTDGNVTAPLYSISGTLAGPPVNNGAVTRPAYDVAGTGSTSDTFGAIELLPVVVAGTILLPEQAYNGNANLGDVDSTGFPFTPWSLIGSLLGAPAIQADPTQMQWNQFGFSPFNVAGVMTSAPTYGADINFGDLSTFGPGRTPWSLDATVAVGFALVGDIRFGENGRTPFETAGIAVASGGNVAVGNISFNAQTPWTLFASNRDGVVINGDAELPAYDMTGASLEPALELPAYTLAGTMLLGVLLDGDSTMLPYMGNAGVMTAGSTIIGSAADLVLPMVSVAALSDNLGGVVLLERAVDGAGFVGTVSRGEVYLPEPDTAGAAYASGRGDGSITMPLATMSGNATLTQSAIIAGAVVMPMFDLAGGALSGTVAQGEVIILRAETSGQAYSSTISRGAVGLDMFTVSGRMTFSATVVSDPTLYKVLTMNSRTAAISFYDNAAYNSMCSFQGAVLAAGDVGLVELTGETDNNAPVDAMFETAPNDYGERYVKNIQRAYVGYRASGKMKVTMILDDRKEYVYTLVPRRLVDLHQSRVVFGRGARSVYWHFRFQNMLGADFKIENMQLDDDVLTRRIR